MIHNQIIVEGVDLDVFMGSALVYAYAACNRLDEARKVFDELGVRNVVCWNTMLEAYAKNGYGASAISLFKEMYTAGIKPDRITFMSVLKACGMVGASKYGVNIHLRAIESGLESSIHVRTALIDMYAKCGRLNEACRNFQKLLHYDVVSCGAMMAGYIQHGDHVCALRMFDKMEAGGIKPDSATFSCALQACGSLGAFQRGKRLHKQAMRSGQVDMMMISTIIDMYARCGDVDEAQEVLDAWPHSGIASWGAMIKGYGLHGNFSLAQHTFERMEERGIKPNEMIYTCIIAACCHAVKVREGQKYFVSMRDSYMTPAIEHFGCMVDLLARAGKLCEAQELLECMPIPPDVKSWMALLTGCRKHDDAVLGRRCFDQVVRLDPSTATGYQIMMEIYAHSNMWGCIAEIRELRKCANAWRKPGKAWIEVDNKIHEFVVGDKNHPECEKIYGVLHRMREAMEKEGYVPGTDLVFEPTMTIRDKEDALCGHSEKLAVAFGLLSSPPGSTIRVSKNLRMCDDCHSACKIVSRIEKRRIIVSDEYCVHHFKDGVCSCGDR
jgi:pentatricopeptide repeat protein